MKKINRKILDPNLRNVSNRKMKPKYITIHETANTSKGANAYMHVKYQMNGSGGRMVSWHYTVDDESIWQTLEDKTTGYHAGDGNGSGNRESIGIEMTINKDGNYKKTVENTIPLVKYLMKKHNISLSRVVTHKHWSGKQCPRKMLDNNEWHSFKEKVAGRKISKPTIDESKTTRQLMTEVLRKNLNGDARKVFLGKDYDRVQKLINKEYGRKQPYKSDKLLMKEVTDKGINGKARKKYLGSRYDAVQKLINKGYSNKSTKKTTKELMKEVTDKGINGKARKKYLGSRYQEVQNLINKRF